jgi:GMP synthase-like glutamine amidotransferase
MTRIGILETGHNAPPLAARFGRFSDAFARWLAVHRDEFPLALEVYHVEAHELPASVDDCDGWIVTGSAAGVYEDHDWLGPTCDFLRAAVAARRRLLGVCFGHQLLAQVLGGRVEKSAKGWGLGRHRYEVHGAAPWMDPPLAAFSLLACHQDQVVAPPPGARVLASSAFCDFAMLAVGDTVLTVQAHPEFSPEYAEALYDSRRERFGEDAARRGIASLGEPTDAEALARWALAFLCRP